MLRLRINYKAATTKWFFTVVLLISYATSHTTAKNLHLKDNPWKSYPYSVQFSPHLGITLPLCLQDLTTYTGSLHQINLLAAGGSLDIGLLYTNRWALQHLNSYPKVGLLLKYDYLFHDTLDRGGYLAGGIFYIEPTYDHLTRWEIVPRLGVGASYIMIPHSHEQGPPITTTTTSSSATVNTDATTGPPIVTAHFRDEIGLNFLLDVLIKYRLSPNFHLNGSIGADIMPHLAQLEPNNAPSTAKRHISKTFIMYRASLGCSYTFNPSNYQPTRTIPERKNRVDFSYLSTLRRPRNFTKKSTMDPSFCYVGGIHTQWSIRLARNHAVVIGSEWIKDGALKKEITTLERPYAREQNLQASVMLGHEFLWGKFICGQHVGFYLINNAPPSLSDRLKPIGNLFYTRLGLNYQITDYLHIGTNLKISLYPTSTVLKPTSTLYARFEYIDFRIGYSF
eukprot:gene157-210_t